MKEKKISILMDDEIFSIQDSYGGISRLNADYINFFFNDQDISLNLPFYFSNNKYLNNTGFKKIHFFKNLNFFKKEKILHKLNSIRVKKEINKNKHDILHLTYMNTDLLDLNKKISTCIVHDVIPERYPKYFNNLSPFFEKKKLLLNKCKKIIANSNTTKKDLLSFYKINENKIEVIYPPIDCTNAPKIEKIKLPERYILYVGNRGGYKSFSTVLELLKKNSVTLMCVGGEKLSKEEQIFLQENKLQNLFLLTRLNDEELNWAYQNAIFFVYSSLYEGFGIPIIEAQRNNCLVLCNNILAFKEVGQESVIYYNNFDELVYLANEIINNKFKNLKKLGKKNIERFSNTNIKTEIKKFYLNLLN
tara:strand:- start:26 stop:1111 length:1086 start_codon:yes stop_codon:yes gene_type:complete